MSTRWTRKQFKIIVENKTSCKRAKPVWRELWRVDEKQEAKSLGSDRTEEEMTRLSIIMRQNVKQSCAVWMLPPSTSTDTGSELGYDK